MKKIKSTLHIVFGERQQHKAIPVLFVFIVFFFCRVWAVPAEMIIYEIMYNPTAGSEYEYIELHNSGPSSFSLTGSYFDDGISYAFTQPVIMPPDSYLVIARSNIFFRQEYPSVTNLADGSYSGKLSNGGERVRLVNSSGDTLCSVDYDDESPWPLLPDGSGVSLEYNQGADDPNNPISWHDSYLHGSPGISNAPPLNSTAVRINEILPSNVSVIEDPDYSDYPDWIELYNNSSQPIDLSNHFLTDDLDEPNKWQIPTGCVISAYGYLVFWADDAIYASTNHGYHLPFKYSADGEDVALVTPDQHIVDAVKYPAILSDISYARNPTNTMEWEYFSDPTPGTANNTPSAQELQIADKPTFSKTAGFYNGTQMISIGAPTPEGVIHYTTDGAKPDYDSAGSTSIVYLSISTTTVIRARTYQYDKLASEVVTHTFIIDEYTTMPVISLSLDPAYLWDDNIGIYVEGTNGAWSIVLNDYYNFVQEWERPAHIEFFENIPSNKCAISIDLGLKMHGFYSRTFAQKGMRLEMRNRYGSESIPWQLFKDRTTAEYSEVIIRNGGSPDWWQTLLRDGFLQTLAKDHMDIDYVAYRPSVTYLNGAFWGIFNLREKIDGDYFSTHYGYEEDEIDLIENYWVKNGSWDHYGAIENFLTTNAMPDDEAYAYLETQLDMNEYLNYQIFQIFVANYDWPGGNIQWWRPQIPTGRWRWILTDLDFTFGLDAYSYASNYVAHATSTNGSFWPTGERATRLFRNLLDLDPYKNIFIQRSASYLNTSLGTENVLQNLYMLKDRLETDMARQIERWRTGGFSTMALWETNLHKMVEFAQYRPTYMRQHIIDYFGLNGTYTLTLGANPAGQGSVLISDAVMPQGWSTNIYFQDIPITLQAVPEIGHRFLRWEGIPGEISNATVSTTFSGNTTVQAIFERTSQTLLPTVITNFMLLEAVDSPYYAIGDIIIPSNSVLQLDPDVELLMPENANIYVYGQILTLGTSEDPVHIKTNPDANARQVLYPHYRNELPARWGAICLENASDVSNIRHTIIEGATHGADVMRFKAAVSAYHSGLTMENVTITNVPFPVFTQFGQITIRKCRLHATDTCDLINIKYADYALTEECTLQGNDAFDMDAIDYDGVTSGMICNNRIFDFTGYNSDGIDLGEEADNVWVQSNHIYNCRDKGISIGQNSSATIEYNTIHDCGQGLAVKDEGSYAYVNHNTFYQNGTAIACFEKNLAKGGGQATIFNSILASSTNESFLCDDKSLISIAYSLSDTDLLPGTANIQGTPNFRHAPEDFAIRSDSPCIDAGDPTTPTDPDGSRTDMGVFYYVRGNPLLQIITPLQGAEFLPGETVHLSGTGTDDNMISLTNLFWTEEILGDLGNGSTLDITTLSTGDNHLTLYGIDGQNATGYTAITISIATDSNENGLPDAWELQHWPTGTSGGATNDADFDGLNNWKEWIAGSDPTNPASVFRITDCTIQTGTDGLLLSWPSITGRYYTISSKELNENNFTPLTNQWSATPPVNAVTITTEGVSPCPQYRIHVTR